MVFEVLSATDRVLATSASSTLPGERHQRVDLLTASSVSYSIRIPATRELPR